MTDVGVAATRNRTMWLVRTCVIGAVGGLICCFLNELLLGFLAPDAYGFFTVIVAGVAAGIVVVLVGIAAYVADAARGRLGMSWKASRWMAAAVCVVGWLPWFVPDEARVSLSAGLAFGPGFFSARLGSSHSRLWLSGRVVSG